MPGPAWRARQAASSGGGRSARGRTPPRSVSRSKERPSYRQTSSAETAFQGSSPREAYFVKCDKETTTQNDINLGIVNVVVGFAPLKPAEFVIIKLQQIAGQIEV